VDRWPHILLHGAWFGGAPARPSRILRFHRRVKPPARRRRHQPALPAHDTLNAECRPRPS
jgi:hypothetical protein